MVIPYFLFYDVWLFKLFAKNDEINTTYCLFIWKMRFRIVYLHQVFIVLDF